MSKKHLIILLTVISSATQSRAESPNLGQPFQDAAVAATILTDGTGLPEGFGNAQTGEALFQTHCMACHGAEGHSGLNDQLIGGQGTLATANPVKTVGSYWPYATTLFDYINRAMPYQAPGSLKPNEIYAVTAYILYKNEIIAVDKELNANSLAKVIMPNRENFIWKFKEK